MSEQIAKSVPMLNSCLKKMDAIGMNSSMNEFQNVFETLDVKVEELNGAMDGVYSSSIDNGEVTSLL